MVESAGAAERKGCRLGGIIVGITVVGILAAIWMPLQFAILETGGHRPVCANNLKQIGTACQWWATAHRQTWPKGYGEGSTRWDDVGNTRADAWSPSRDGGDPPSEEPADNKQPVQSNSASLWLVVASAGLTPDVFLCDKAKYVNRQACMRDYTAVRDFRGETFVSYSYQNVLGPYKLTQTSAYPNSTQFAVAADANPMRRDFWSGAPGGGVPIGATNKKLAERPLFEDAEETQAWNRSTKFIRHPWELNSPNHDFKGQNVLFLDGHVEWTYHPYCGPKWDNIWLRRRTDVSAEIDPKNIETLRACNDETSYNGTSTLPEDSQDDSFLVP